MALPIPPPEAARLAAARKIAFALIVHACDRHAGTLRSAQHVADADLIGGLGQIISAAHAANALQHPGAHESAAQLLQILDGKPLTLRGLPHSDKRARLPLLGDIDHKPEGVPSPCRNHHRSVPSSPCRAPLPQRDEHPLACAHAQASRNHARKHLRERAYQAENQL